MGTIYLIFLTPMGCGFSLWATATDCGWEVKYIDPKASISIRQRPVGRASVRFCPQDSVSVVITRSSVEADRSNYASAVRPGRQQTNLLCKYGWVRPPYERDSAADNSVSNAQLGSRRVLRGY